ncbi:hypothetical protein LTR54_015316 [Friedmanniomyces endolithicus]|uniref:Uncharacterized protein n=1 Tax=Friedmanniomyces endolithicus TaxID=329885 RepID=A0AAN6FAP9_9PEZI|nr:hypothetical protein LTR82_015357 [Friedmanniomyces endolithicus]KAK0980504.1 hypothetical protein LTR54_015316 [Friedmanniomyces endolithicus]
MIRASLGSCSSEAGIAACLAIYQFFPAWRQRRRPSVDDSTVPPEIVVLRVELGKALRKVATLEAKLELLEDRAVQGQSGSPSTRRVEVGNLDRSSEEVPVYLDPALRAEMMVGAWPQAPPPEDAANLSTQAVEAGNLDSLDRVEGPADGPSASDKSCPAKNPGMSSSRRRAPVSSKSEGKKPRFQL